MTNIALCGFLMVIVGFGFQAVYADVDERELKQLERIALQSDQQTTQQSAQPQSNHDSSFSLTTANGSPFGITYHDDKFWVADHNENVYAYTINGTYDA